MAFSQVESMAAGRRKRVLEKIAAQVWPVAPARRVSQQELLREILRMPASSPVRAAEMQRWERINQRLGEQPAQIVFDEKATQRLPGGSVLPATTPQPMRVNIAEFIRKYGGDFAKQAMAAATPALIHKICDQKGIPWDNDRQFMQRCQRVVGKAHLDAMTGAELRKLAKSLLCSYEMSDTERAEVLRAHGLSRAQRA